MRLATCIAFAALAGSGVLACGGDAPASDAAAGSTGSAHFNAARAFGDLRAQVAIGPRPSGSAANEREVRLIVNRLRRAGARGVRVQHPHANVVARIPGTEPGAIVLGAHHDTKDGIPGFVGANDGASGVAVVLEIARDLPRTVEGPSVRFVLFDAEESRPGQRFEDDGERGSRQYVRFARHGGTQGSPPLSEIRAMVLLDMVGDCDLAIPRESNSDIGLYDAIASAAASEGGGSAPFEGDSGGVLDDHIPFLEAGVPAVDLIDFDYGPGPTPGAWWHTPKDKLNHVCAKSLGAVGRPLLTALPQLG